jgi:NAD(P)-dependent dehydrogenase (short-subunit alcohol dehydrogenase family)
LLPALRAAASAEDPARVINIGSIDGLRVPAVQDQVPLRRIGRPDDIAGLTLFLASRAGSYLTGAVIPLDGGITGCG